MDVNLKKILKICLIFLIIFIIISALGFICFIYNSVSTKEYIADLNNISMEEKEKMIQLNYLKLESYPDSIEFILIREEVSIRESQYYIKFSIDKKDSDIYKLERDESYIAGGTNIKKIDEQDNKIIYEFSTNFTNNSKR